MLGHGDFSLCLLKSEVSEFSQKKVFKRKLISVPFQILKDKDDYLDATMITQEIKSRNAKP